METRRAITDPNLVFGCRREAGQPESQTIRVTDRQAFQVQPGPDTETASVTADITRAERRGLKRIDRRSSLARGQYRRDR